MKIFITGIAGFLGSHLAQRLLDEGHTVGGMDNLSGGELSNVPEGVYFKEFDCLHGKFTPELNSPLDFDYCWQPSEFGVPDVVVHCAALAHEGLSTFSPHLITQSIFGASVRTFSQAITHGVKRIVFMSSMSRYGNGAWHFCTNPSLNGLWEQKHWGPPFDEDNIPNPVDPYGVAKVAAEDALKILSETHGVKWSILVPHNIIGVRQKYDDAQRNVASIMMNRCLQGKPPIIYGDGQQKRCFSPIADCLPSIVKAVHGEADYEVVNIGPDNGEITINELAAKIIRLTGSPFAYNQVVRMPDRPNEVKNAYCSSDKARKLLGYKEQQSIDDCLAEMVADIRKRGTREFKYLPIEILNDKTPKTWVERLI